MVLGGKQGFVRFVRKILSYDLLNEIYRCGRSTSRMAMQKGTKVLLYEINDDPKRKEFLDDLFSYMQKRVMPRILVFSRRVSERLGTRHSNSNSSSNSSSSSKVFESENQRGGHRVHRINTTTGRVFRDRLGSQ
uniref:Uncharacterized protein n=1 Tax=Vespula pensylvanica TaxID=30213 RepID=A0A834JKS7_VESPE|nr:hypothetical protein H0235_017820 [Vespula pensylvanica]